MKELEHQARKDKGGSWYSQFVRKAKDKGYNPNVGNLWASRQADGVTATKLEDDMKNDKACCGWNHIFEREYTLLELE